MENKYLAHPIFPIISQVANETAQRAFVIGGFVRDCFLARKTDDIDIVIEGSGIDFAMAVSNKIKALESRSCKVSYFKNFGTAMLRYRGLEIEFVGARKESYHRDSRKPIVEDGSLEDDQKRRDFTINAMAFSLNMEDYGRLVDPFNGLEDLEAGRLRTPLEPEQTYSDDPLRMLRAIRFASKLSTDKKRFYIVPESLSAIKKMSSRMSILSKERIAEELNKMLLSPKPSIALALLDQNNLLPYILPDLEKLKGVETVEGRGHKDNFTHTLKVVDNLVQEEADEIALGHLYDYTPLADGDGFSASLRKEPNLWLRWAALLHDIGKPKSKKYDSNIGWTFHGHDVIGSRLVAKIFKELKLPQNEKMKYVQKLVYLHHRPSSLADSMVTDSALRRLLFDAGNDIDDLMLLCNADITSKNQSKVKRIKKAFDLVRQKLQELEQRDAIRNWKNPITGEYIMEVYDIKPSKVIGDLKELIKNAILDGEIENSFEAADAYLREQAAKLGLVAIK